MPMDIWITYLCTFVKRGHDKTCTLSDGVFAHALMHACVYVYLLPILCDVIYGELSADTLDKCKYESAQPYIYTPFSTLV